MREKIFDDDGNLTDEQYKKLSSQKTLVGEDAILFLAEMFAGETHGNYSAEILYRRAELGKRYKVSVEEIKEDSL